MTLVVDSSVLVAATVDAGAEGDWAESLIGAGSLVAPHLILAETTNVLRRLERCGRLSSLEATSSQRDLPRLPLELMPFGPFADRVWELRGNLSAYDAWYVAVAEAFEVPLATLDRKLSRAPGVRCRFVVPASG